MNVRALAFAFLVSSAPAIRAEEPKPSGPVPVPYPNVSTTAAAAPRDAASGQATGKRMHKPVALVREFDRRIGLADGRVFLVNSKTGEVVFGDGATGERLPKGTPPDGTYRTGGGAAGNVQIRAGRLVVPTPVPTPAASRAPVRVK